jgi:hypothetical protein
MLFILIILIAKKAFKDYKIIKELLSLMLPNREIYPL